MCPVVKFMIASGRRSDLTHVIQSISDRETRLAWDDFQSDLRCRYVIDWSVSSIMYNFTVYFKYFSV
jgi:hypothetical protein